MIRLSVIFPFIIVLLAILPTIGLHPNSYADQNYNVNLPDRGKILNVFKKAIDLNEDFKKTVNTIPLDEHLKKREELEKFDEEVLTVKIEDCVKLISAATDTELAVEFFKLLISYENSADERLSYALGKVFLHNPDLIIETFNKFKRPDQQYLYKTLEWGWRNVIYAMDKSEPEIQDRIKRLEGLESRVFKSANIPQTENRKSENIINNQTQRVQDEESVKKTSEEVPQGKEPYWETRWFYPAISGLGAVLISLIVTWSISAYRRRKACRSLIVAFASEFVLAFHRCVIYYMQDVKEEGVSFSGLFNFTNDSTLSAYAAVGSKPQLIAAIIYLKQIYFQIARHVEEAAKYAVESERYRLVKNKKKQERYSQEAMQARARALAFFLAPYHKGIYELIEEKTEMIVKKLKKTLRSRGAKYLSSVFNVSKDVKRELDWLDKQRKELFKQLEEKADRLMQKDDNNEFKTLEEKKINLMEQLEQAKGKLEGCIITNKSNE